MCRWHRLGEQAFVLIVTVTFALAASGCSQRQSVEQAVNKALANARQEREKVYPLAGKVTIDFQTPHFEKPAYKLIVMLNDSQQPHLPMRERPFAVADSDGAFEFQTYVDGDGVKCGKFILTFAVLRKKSKIGFVGPDQLHNLYNSPDHNSKLAEFVVEHQAPGRIDYTFNLEVAGKEAGAPNPPALTELSWGH
jgi:hypothetical protein